MGKIMHGGISYSGGGGSGGASAMSDLTDVELTNLADGQIMKYDATNQVWVNNNESGGTTVIANPTGQATDTLNKLQVGSTIYGVSGGSSQESYSTTEQVIGTWIDGKPLYQKTIQATNKKMGNSASDSQIEHGVSNLDFGWVESILFNNGSQDNYGMGTAYGISTYPMRYFVTATKIFCRNESWNANASRTWIITIRYTKTTD